jgi:hypothetical protein
MACQNARRVRKEGGGGLLVFGVCLLDFSKVYCVAVVQFDRLPPDWQVQEAGMTKHVRAQQGRQYGPAQANWQS